MLRFAWILTLTALAAAPSAGETAIPMFAAPGKVRANQSSWALDTRIIRRRNRTSRSCEPLRSP